MTRTVVATFDDAEAARRAAVALGRAELAAGPTRVQVAAAGADRSARLELRVEEPDASRAIALMREHGAEVADRDVADSRDLRSGGPLAAWGMAVADAVTAAMAGATASDAQVPADLPDRHPHRGDPERTNDAVAGPSVASRAGPSDVSSIDDAPGPPVQDDTGPRAAGTMPPIWGNAPSHGAAGSGSGTHLSDTVDAGTASSMGQVGPGTTITASMGATDETGTASGTRTRADPADQRRADDVPPRDPRRRRPRSDA
jgi:hypothetical protein